MILIAATLVIVLGITGLAIDTALLMHNHASLQSSADAAALIAAAELRDKPYSGERAARDAVYKALVLGGADIKLKDIRLDSAPAGFAPMKDFFFSNGTQPGYTQVTLIDKSATTFLGALGHIGAETTQISAQAVAGFETVDGDDGPQLFLVR